jgi:hypothetical protein
VTLSPSKTQSHSRSTVATDLTPTRDTCPSNATRQGTLRGANAPVSGTLCSADAPDSGDETPRPAYTPVHLRTHTANVPDHERLAVTPQMLNSRVPDLSPAGGKNRAWYVVARGLEIGVFMDYWQVVIFFQYFADMMM